MNCQRDFKAVVVGLVTAILTAAFMLMAFKQGVSPLPEPLGLAFAEAIFGTTLPNSVGFEFHAAWVILWTLVYARLSPGIRFSHALYLAAALWLSALVIFMPVAGWGFLGLGVTPKLIVAAIVPHVLFAVFMWGGCRLLGMAERAR
ncbi:hypothetical protein HKX42_04060 [Salinisphaera sp. USBA-960]|uniref:hypothetical protein n=1 Tax=Salinisphaera orenii TaxID=856731 RepID=UPI000DBE172C|nr:hypothetical protein [Salifodinibacter halophilus]NNC26049.1 hypothetical protein [Salifodinibacter halophilus]